MSNLLHPPTDYRYVEPRFRSLGRAWIWALGEVLCGGALVFDDQRPLREVRNMLMHIDDVDSADPIVLELADPHRVDLMRRKYASCEIVAPYTMSYGKLLYNNGGIDQVQGVIDRLKKKPETKSATIALHSSHHEELSCLSLLDFKVRRDYLDVTAVYRSQDVFNSQPGNVIALREVQESVADAIGSGLGAFTLHAISAHIYRDDLDGALDVVQRSRVQRANGSLR